MCKVFLGRGSSIIAHCGAEKSDYGAEKSYGGPDALSFGSMKAWGAS
jgi:hypothetical protein